MLHQQCRKIDKRMTHYLHWKETRLMVVENMLNMVVVMMVDDCDGYDDDDDDS